MKKCLILFSVFILSSCASIYQSPNFQNDKKNHKIIAILPFQITIAPKFFPKGITEEMLKAQEKETAYLMQNHIYFFFLNKTYDVEFQDISKTNLILKEAALEYEDLPLKLRKDLCKLLGVDVILSGNCKTTKPMSDIAAVSNALLFGAWGTTNEVTTSLSILDKNGKLHWKYKHSVSGGLGSSSQQITMRLMGNVVNKFPYKQ